LAKTFKKRLSGCLDNEEDGSLKMTITLPDEFMLENLAKSLAKMASAG